MGLLDQALNNLYIQRVCPSCIQSFYPGDCRIISTTTKGKVLEDAPIGWKRHVSRMYPKPLKGHYVLELACRECPNCGYALPPNIELVENLSIAIVGDTYSGKSHFIAALIHQMRQGNLQGANQFARFNCLTQDVEQIYQRDVIQPLFEKKRTPDSTQNAIDINRPPLIYELIITPDPERPPRHLNLILYDASGEDLATRERMVQFSRYVLHANAMVFLADPMSMPEIFKLLPPHLQQKYQTTGRRVTSVFNSILSLIEQYRGQDAGARLASTPIAITLAKSDLLKQLTAIQKQYSFLKKPTYNGTVNLQELDQIDQEVRQLLQDYGEQTLLNAAYKLSNIKFLATSATGYAPDQNGIYPTVDPCRCLDPIAWILYKLDILHT